MDTYCSTTEAAERSGATYRQLDYFVRTGLVSPPEQRATGEDRLGQGNGQARARRWRPADVAAARAVAALIGTDPSGRPTDLAKLAATAAYAWHGSAPFAVIALNRTIEPAQTVEECIALADRLRLDGVACCTVVGLGEDDSNG